MWGPYTLGQWVGLSPVLELAPPGVVLVGRYELGPALYLGWSASLLAILGGACLCSSCFCGPDDNPPAAR